MSQPQPLPHSHDKFIAAIIIGVVVAAIVGTAIGYEIGFYTEQFSKSSGTSTTPPVQTDVTSLSITVDCTGCSYNTTAWTYNGDRAIHSAQSATLISVTYSNSSWSIHNSFSRFGNETAIYAVTRTDMSHKWTVSWWSNMFSNTGILRVTVVTNTGQTVFHQSVSPSYGVGPDYGAVIGYWST